MNNLNVTKFGKGPELVLLHGWGSTSKIWQTLIGHLSKHYQVWCIDLPGHGDSHSFEWDEQIEQGIEIFSRTLPRCCSIVGWSLGGLIAQLYTAHYPERVRKLKLISSTPRFINCEQWQNGMEEDVFLNFVNQFDKNPAKSLKRFTTLQVLNSEKSKVTKSVLIESLSGQQCLDNIKWGLSWLQEVDLRENEILKEFAIDLLYGENDQVVSFSSVHQTEKIWNKVRLFKFADSGHAPFISHQNEFFKFVEY